MKILQGRAIPYILHGDESCAVIVSFQGVDGKRMLTCLWIAMDYLLNSKKKMVSEGRVVECGLHSIKFFRLLWETLAAPVSPTSSAWVEHAGIFEQSNLHFVFQLLEYASSIVM